MFDMNLNEECRMGQSYIPPKLGFDHYKKDFIDINSLDLSKPEDVKKYIDYKFKKLSEEIDTKLEDINNDIENGNEKIMDKLRDISFSISCI